MANSLIQTLAAGLSLDVFVTHMAAGKHNGKTRKCQVEQLIDEVTENGENFTIVGGDFNFLPESEEYTSMGTFMKNAMAEVYPNNWTQSSLATYNNKKNSYYNNQLDAGILDYFFYGNRGDNKRFRVRNCWLPFITIGEEIQVITNSLSDHEGIACLFHLL